MIYQLSKKSAGTLSEYIGLVNYKIIILVRNFSQIHQKFDQASRAEKITIDLEENVVIEHLLFGKEINAVKKDVYEEIDDKMVLTGSKSDLDKILEATQKHLEDIYIDENIVSFINYNSIRGEKIKLSKFDQTKWLHKAQSYFGVSEEGSDKS